MQGLFREGECSPQDARTILSTIRSPGTLLHYEYEGNVYLLDVDLEQGVVTLRDDLDPTPRGSLHLTIEETIALLEDFLGEKS